MKKELFEELVESVKQGAAIIKVKLKPVHNVEVIIQESAKFWDHHDLTDFEDQLEDVQAPVFKRKPTIKVQLQPEEI